eukprot:CAMPEP_0172511466 /NCGR_PEP_ID=MMETSP1066-20121228/236624_1 /TAXON_ID=671091 /ORGANISM="Coscinodiscus wailesii, Strain CCMP2513" /LENGTH=164 /DNA_ID=CAMNT_0013290841 /DNA_START=109 /DNA_END=603 /DNA_ORIENTATION=-
MTKNILLLICAAIALCSPMVPAFAPLHNIQRATDNNVRYSNIDSRKFNFFENIGSMISNFGKKATASHILIGPKTMNQEDARAKLIEIKEAVDNDPEKFAEMAMEWSSCPSKKKGGDLGSFNAGMMVKNFDRVCFEEEVGVVHGPVSTQFGEHLIFLRERTGED